MQLLKSEILENASNSNYNAKLRLTMIMEQSNFSESFFKSMKYIKLILHYLF
jgi:hypothetical protein